MEAGVAGVGWIGVAAAGPGGCARWSRRAVLADPVDGAPRSRWVMSSGRSASAGIDAFPDRGVPARPSTCTAPTNRYPRRGSVSIKPAPPGPAPRASRRRLMITFMPCSKSTTRLSGQRRWRNSSRDTNCPGRSRSVARAMKDWLASGIRAPSLKSSYVCGSASKDPNRIRPSDAPFLGI